MTAVYEKHGLKFLYPENWTLTDGQELDSPHSVEIETPDGALWSVSAYPKDLDSEQLLKDALQGLQDTYEDVETSEAEPDFEGFPTLGINSYFYCLDFMVMARIQVIETLDYKLVLLYQAESREFDKQLDVFRAVTLSLLQSLQSNV